MVIRIKLIIMLSLIAETNVCEYILSYKTYAIVQALQKNVVNKDWFKELVSKQFSLNGNYLIDFNTEKRVSD